MRRPTSRPGATEAAAARRGEDTQRRAPRPFRMAELRGAFLMPFAFGKLKTGLRCSSDFVFVVSPKQKETGVFVGGF